MTFRSKPIPNYKDAFQDLLENVEDLKNENLNVDQINIETLWLLAEAHLNGFGTPKNTEKYHECLETISTIIYEKNPSLEKKLIKMFVFAEDGEMQRNPRIVPAVYQKYFSICRPKLNINKRIYETKFMRKLHVAYEYGIGLPINEKKAQYWEKIRFQTLAYDANAGDMFAYDQLDDDYQFGWCMNKHNGKISLLYEQNFLEQNPHLK